MSSEEPASTGRRGVCPNKYGMMSLITLVVQGCLHSLVLRFSRTIPGPRYLASVAVILTEALKIVACLSVLVFGCWKTSRTREELNRSITARAADLVYNSLPMAVPATMYVMQQMLVIVAATHLDVVTFQICSQMKVFPTAVFASSLLGQHLSAMQWLSLPMLAGGVSLVTATGNSTSNDSAQTDWTLGVAACLVSGISSAFAGVYFEKFVKGMETSSLWIRNCQLSMYGLPLAMVSLVITDRTAALEGGLFQGFSAWTWGAIVLQAFGGIVVGMVVKYADNILKNFANALSVICTVICAIPLFGQYPSPWSILGLLFTFLSIFMYSNALGPLLPVSCCGGDRNGEALPLLPGGKCGDIEGSGSFRRWGLNLSSKDSDAMLYRRVILASFILVGLATSGYVLVRATAQNSISNGYVLWGQIPQAREVSHPRMDRVYQPGNEWRPRPRIKGEYMYRSG